MNGYPAAWPEPTSENRPWTRWWWLGSAVNHRTLTELLTEYSRVGFGGVEVTCIYGVRGQEENNLEFLSPQWLEMVRHTIAEADRLGMQVDFPPGCGWRFGGPFITEDLAAAKLTIGSTSDGGESRVECHPSAEKVKRPGPGGEGRSFNPFSRASLQAVINHFTPVLRNLGIRAQFHDSWEYGSNASLELFDQFQARRGYDLRTQTAELAGEADADRCARVRYDLHRTLGELALESFITPWAEWCHALGQLSRNHAHGSPGNWLDLYAAVDIPETESFRDVTTDTPLLFKFASHEVSPVKIIFSS